MSDAMTSVLKYFCPCCGYDSLEREPGMGSFDICDICFWEDDPAQSKDPKLEDGANKCSLNQARQNFDNCGACDPQMVKNVRKPTAADKRDPDWSAEIEKVPEK